LFLMINALGLRDTLARARAALATTYTGFVRARCRWQSGRSRISSARSRQSSIPARARVCVDGCTPGCRDGASVLR
jgi:hypothetical protein